MIQKELGTLQKKKGFNLRILKDKAAKAKLLLLNPQVRLMIKQAKMDGKNEAWDEACQKYDEQELKNKEAYEQRVDIIKTDYDKRVTDLKAEHNFEMKQLKDKHLEDYKQLKSEFTKKLDEFSKSYKHKCSTNDQLREEAVADANRIKESARRSEDYWRNQIDDFRAFMHRAISVVQTIADRYEFLQSSMSKVQIGSHMVEDLQKSFQNLVKYAHKSAPPILGDAEYK